MPAIAPASPAVVMVHMPSRNDIGLSNIGIGLHRIGAGGSSTSTQGAVRQFPESDFSIRPQCCTVGRIR